MGLNYSSLYKEKKHYLLLDDLYALEDYGKVVKILNLLYKSMSILQKYDSNQFHYLYHHH